MTSPASVPSSPTVSTLEPLFTFLANALTTVETSFNKLPGSQVIQRYVRSSHQNDPGRTILELILVVFAIRTLLQSRTRANQKHFIQFSDKEIDELVEEWTPEPLGHELTPTEQADLAAVPIVAGPNGPKPKLVSTGKTALNLASLNFAGLAGNEHIKERAVETLRKYGLGSCGPPGFYGTLDVHIDLERDIADFLGTEASILYSQGFSTVSSVIPAFCKRGDIIVADRAVNFAIQKGIQISRSTVRWYDHNDLKSLEEVLIQVEKERKRKRGPLTRRFIITEGIFERDGAMVDLPKLIELKQKYKYRLILDESYSFGSVGRTGRGLTEVYNVPASKVDMLLGSAAIGLCAAGGFCAGSQIVVDHQRINGPSFVFSAAMPALLAVSASEGINIFRSTPSIFETLQENIRAARAILDKLDCIHIPSHPASPIIHITLKTPSQAPVSAGLHPSSAALISPTKAQKDNSKREWDVDLEERMLQEVVEDALAQGVMITRAKRLRGQEWNEPRPSIRLALTAGLTRKETEKAVNVVKAALVKVVAKRK
ncbi:serine C-palmitoyltransferase [Coprinopsis cinerea okayama7|uniref:serine C-palmitoyltransferase n=1 Tax=Coprinopsis cinerea (strain Okayama-7 / 130 / ATCC MYA-4618 / FGSC 9003) TaxID=240176 RepID=A8P173_COPC7|nr:serine C-palmitoyltransferase [Coprinopsis cinerea okayama7\|eukprot:XP_001838038.1 serine C-palmitoyltransferase [Coprinopsis cinerea okayama7\